MENSIKKSTLDKLLDANVGNRIHNEILQHSIACSILDLHHMDSASIDKVRSEKDTYIIAKYRSGYSSINCTLDGLPESVAENTTKFAIPVRHLESPVYNGKIQDFKEEGFSHLLSWSLIAGIDKHFVTLLQYATNHTEKIIEHQDICFDKRTVIKAVQAVMENDNLASSMLIRTDDFLAVRELSQGLKWELKWWSNAAVHEDYQKEFSSMTSKKMIGRLLRKEICLRLEDLEIILHNQDDLVPPGHVYVFTSPTDLGEIRMDQTAFEAEKKFENLNVETSLYTGANIFNVGGVARIELGR